jgi:two-component system phosphate regulon sensor histidine kinase PhoR
MIFLRSMLPVAIALAIAGVIALLFTDQAAAWWLVLAFAAYGVFNSRYLSTLHEWAALPTKRELPLGSGPWALVLDRLSRHVRQESDDRGELVAELERIHSAVDQLPDGLVVLDRYDHVEWSNNAAEELHAIFGRHRPIHHFVRQPEFIAYLERADFAKPIVLQLPTRPGRLFEVRIHHTREQLKLMITRDITDSAKLDAVRRDFVANVSHEIRTPVTVIGGFAETLLELDLDEPTRREYLGAILKQSQTMQRLVEDLLMLSTLENSSAPPALEEIDVGAMVQAIAAEARTLSHGRHEIDTRLETDMRLRGAPTEIESALRNLVTNAIRYTPDGGRIALAWRIRGDEGWLSVSDTGIGIAAEHLPRLTERFYRVERSRSRETGGTGLGLAIVKHVLQRHDGRLDIRSEPGTGSTFSLRFPADKLVAATAAPLAPEGAA